MGRRNRVAGIVLAAGLMLVAAAAQDKPDFTGIWKQNLEKSPTKTSFKSYVNKIAIEGDKLVITTTTAGDRGERTYERTYIIGKEEKSQDREGDQFTNTVSIEGRSLIFETIEKERDAVLKTHEVWTISEDGNTLTKVRKMTGGPRGDYEQTFVFEKQGS